ncbi:MAG: protein-glutamate O-methyltransferase CheR [Candidatus Omnitrophica bacterium]|nr:protein-glutamate O-methyltransferase CheR [Candidatus Omnitrophota bacterium]
MEDKNPQVKGKIFGDEKDLAKIVAFVNQRFGIDLAYYRLSFLYRHMRGRLLDAGCKDSTEYIALLKRDPDEFQKFLETLSINVTHFFRDIEVFDSFSQNVIPELLKRKELSGERSCIRVWSAGCASGQETYSLAIMFLEALGRSVDFRITGTDVDPDALKKAAEGVYDERFFRETPKKILDKYFTLLYNKAYRVNDEIRAFVKFEKNNLITDEPLRHVDVIFCRNVLIYFNRAQQDLIFSKFFSGLNTTGYLVVAKVETIWDKDKFASVDLGSKIYQKAQ